MKATIERAKLMNALSHIHGVVERRNTIPILSNVLIQVKDNTLLQDAYKCSNGDAIDFNDYGNEEHDLALCWTNQAVDAVNKKWNKHYANGKQVEVNGFKQSKFILLALSAKI